MAVGDIEEAEMMTGLLTGAVLAGLMKIADTTLAAPVEFMPPDAAGVVQMRLASGMLVTITVDVEPVP